MIILGKAVSHINSLVNYVYKEEKQAYVLDSYAIDTFSSKTILEDFKLFRNERLKNQYLSLVISPAENSLDDKVFKEIVQDTLKELNLSSNQFLCVIHDNTEHKHAHLLINRTNYKGETFNDSYIGLKGIKIGELIAKNQNLKSAFETRKLNRTEKRHKKSDYHSSLNQSINSIRKLIDDVLEKPATQTIDDVFNHLTENKINIEITKHKNGTFGVVLEYEGVKFKASDVSRKLTILPDENGYKANKLLQPILDRNIQKFEKSEGTNYNRDVKDILEDISKYPHNAHIYSLELKQIIANGYYSSPKGPKNSDDDERKNKRKLKKKHQLGFKIQI